MSKVFVIDTNCKPLNPIHPAQARQFLRSGKAAIYKQFPFTLSLKKSCVEAEVKRLQKVAKIEAISCELVRFDMQLMGNSDIQGKEYQQGALAGYETREYLLEKWGRECAYYGAKDVPLEVELEHIYPKSKGGSNSITNLTLSCHQCNTKKGTQDIKDFLKGSLRLEKILKQAKKPLTDAAAVNATRNALFAILKETGLPIENGSGGLTKFNKGALIFLLKTA